jgi:hypothetical protein
MTTRRQLLVGGLLVALLLGVGVVDVTGQFSRTDAAAATAGTVQTASVEVERLNRPRRINNEVYRTNLTYTYTVDGQQYTGYGPFPEWASGTERATVTTVEQFSPGERVTVYYRPSTPADSYLVERYAFLPGFLALVAAPYLLAALTTPGFSRGTIREMLLRAATDDTGRIGPPPTSVDDDPTEGVDWLPVTGAAEWIVWGVATLVGVAVVGVYLSVSPPGSRRLGYAVALIALVGTGVRTAFRLR